MHRAIFLDRDGVLNVDLGYTYKPSDLRLVDGAVSGLKILKDLGYKLIVITNQSGVARGFFSLSQVDAFHEELLRKIRQDLPGFEFDEIMVCPHHPEGKIPEFSISCECRKPGIKLITDATSKLDLDIKKSWLVGDKESDIDCAINAGMKGIQVTKGGKQYGHSSKAFAKVGTLLEAAKLIESTISNEK